MHHHRFGAAAHKASRAGVLIAGLHVLAGGSIALAQTAPPAAAADSDQAPSEAARRQALGPYRFILQNANAPAPKPKAAAPVEAKRPAAPEQTAVAAPRSRGPAPAPVAAPEPEPPPAPVAAPVAAFAPKPAEPTAIVAVRKELVAIKQDPPELTVALRREQVSGTVKVGFDVNPDGSTSGVKVLSSTNRKLNNLSMAAVAGWKFKPIDEVRPSEIELVFSNQ
jgi:TonB family protein